MNCQIIIWERENDLILIPLGPCPPSKIDDLLVQNQMKILEESLSKIEPKHILLNKNYP